MLDRVRPFAILMLWLAWCLGRGVGRAEIAYLTPAADTSLIEIVPAHNFGGSPFFNAGTTQTGTRNHGLLRFEVAAALPAGARISSVELSLEVVGRPADGFAAAVFELRAVRRAWGEGVQVAGSSDHPGLGAPAAEGEADWLECAAGTGAFWTEPGGAWGADVATEVSSEQTIYGVPDSPYVFATSERMVADVQGWLDRPATNFGWMLLPRDESIRFSARRFASREDAGRAPVLTVDYMPPPGFTGVERAGEEVRMKFDLPAGWGCSVETSAAIGPTADWTVVEEVAPPAAATSIVVRARLQSGAHFYRLRLQPPP